MLVRKMQKDKLGKRVRKFSLSEHLNAVEIAVMKTLQNPTLIKIQMLHTWKKNCKLIEKAEFWYTW